jgi:hypothetical protein
MGEIHKENIVFTPHGGFKYTIKDYENSIRDEVELVGGMVIEAFSDK